MKRSDITRISYKHGDPFPETDTDWAAVDAMSDEEVVARALSDPDAQPMTPEQLARFRRAMPDVRAIRRRVGMTQMAFARAFQIPLGTLRDWEQRRKEPDAPAKALLRIIEREPEAARRALAA